MMRSVPYTDLGVTTKTCGRPHEHKKTGRSGCESIGFLSDRAGQRWLHKVVIQPNGGVKEKTVTIFI